jgi:hypothetical protein
MSPYPTVPLFLAFIFKSSFNASSWITLKHPLLMRLLRGDIDGEAHLAFLDRGGRDHHRRDEVMVFAVI